MSKSIRIIASLAALAAAVSIRTQRDPADVGVMLALPSPGQAEARGRQAVPRQRGSVNGPAGRILYYQDPMHPWYHSDKPGLAPDCGM